jgi:hypothetical protein
MKGRTSWIGLLIACSIGVCSGAAAAQPAAPPARYKIDEKYTQKSPDGAITIEQYLNKDTDDWKWQFWVRRQGTFTLLDPEPAGYPADFIFTNDLKWIVRVQKIGSGTFDAPSVPPEAAGLFAREQEAARRPGVGLSEDPSRLAKDREGAGVSHLGVSAGGA